jgi:hypothetical protein
MQEPRTWRELLSILTSNAQEKRHITEQLGISPVTLTRWISHKSTPHENNLASLLEVFPQHRQQFITLLQKEFPHFTVEKLPIGKLALEIPSSFYREIFHTYQNYLPLQRTTITRKLILQQMLEQLDISKAGMNIILEQCMPPGKGKKVRSLRVISRIGTPPWKGFQEDMTYFVGAESQAGHSVLSGRLIATHTREEKMHAYPTDLQDREESVITCPVFRSNKVAGCLYIASLQPHSFGIQLQELIQSFADLTTLAFEERDFYAPGEIDLGILPPASAQQPYIAGFTDKVLEYMRQLMELGQPVTWPEAAQAIWQNIEENLLHFSYSGE